MKQCQCDPKCPLEPGENGLCVACDKGWCMHPNKKEEDFRGDWQRCDRFPSGCILPAGHGGSHAQ